jgi:hypothetical protein
MGFFSFIETFFFISLAITFVLIMLLVYHFKQRLSVVETKTDTMFEIMNNLLKEMKVIKTMVSIPNHQENQHHPQNGHHFGLFDMMMPMLQKQQFTEHYEDDEQEEPPIKIINLEHEAPSIDIETIDIQDENDESECSDNESEIDEMDEIVEPLEKIDYKSLEISQLRALAVERGIDPSKKKKGELIQLLQQ